MKKQTWIAAVLALTLIGSNPVLCAAAEEAESVTAEVLEEAMESDDDSENLELTEEELAENRYYYENDGEALRYLNPDGTWILTDEEELVGAGVTDQLVHDPRFANYIRHYGIDVSYHENQNRAIDWNRVKASGREFAIIRIGYRTYQASGKINEDTWGIRNLKGALDAGLKVGVYIYSQALNEAEAVEEADYLVNQVGTYKNRITMGFVMDYEYADNDRTHIGRLANAKLSKAQATKNATAFCERIASQALRPMIYADSNYLQNSLNASELDQKYPIWMARYRKAGADYPGKYQIWQYSGSMKIDGIPSPKCDADVWYEEPAVRIPDQLEDPDVQMMYRLYNPNSGEHFYTKSKMETENTVRAGWKYEGIGWYAPKSSNQPVYRLYNPNAGDHHYTKSEKERELLVSEGWNYEGTGWYSSEAADKVTLYRLYNPNATSGAHHFTKSTLERDMLKKAGWSYEGESWYGVPYDTKKEA